MSLHTLSSIAFAAGSARVILLEGDEVPLGRKVRAEAEAAGLTIVEPSPDVSVTSNPELLERYGAAALIRLVSTERAEVYVGRAEDGSSFRTLSYRAADGESFAVRIVEEVHARLVELKLILPEENSPAAAELPASRSPHQSSEARSSLAPRLLPVADDLAQGRRPPPKLWFSSGLAALQPSGGLGGSVHGALGLEIEPTARTSVAAHALVPLTENNLSGPEGSADVNVNLFVAELGYRVLAPSDSWSVRAGVGAGVLVLGMNGQAEQPMVGRSDRLVSGVYFVHGSITCSLASWLRLKGMLLAGVGAPRPVVRFDEREVAAWGRTFGGVALSTEFGLALRAPEAP